MESKMKESDNNLQFDPNEWLRQLESGERSDPILALAASINELTPEVSGPSLSFKSGLRGNLTGQFAQQRSRTQVNSRWFAWGFVALVVILLMLFGLRNLPERTPSVNAAEILNLASQRLNSQTSQVDILYDRIIMDWERGGNRKQGFVGELWRTPDGAQLRYQMFDADRLIYFDQHDGEHIWRASHIRPLEATQVDFVYQAPYIPEDNDLENEQLIYQLLFRDLGNFWVYIDHLAGGENADCANPFCVLSALGDGWKCTTSSCTLNLGKIPNVGELIVEAKVIENEWLSNGHEVRQVRIQIAGEDERHYRVLKFDTETYDLLEIEYYSRGKLRYRIRLDDRHSLTWSEMPDEFFNTIPYGVEVRPWKSNYPLGHQSIDRVWVISADPPSGMVLSDTFNAHIKLGYKLTSIEKAAINIGGLNWSGHDTRVKLDVDEIIVDAGEGEIDLDFVVDTTELGEGGWAIWPAFRDILGINHGPGIGWNSLGDPGGIYVEWCIHCQDPTADS
jgi:hypothetical protein